ncbi:hypothetical protein Aperf_G00000021805 [Anoplocephala perfoliata]
MANGLQCMRYSPQYGLNRQLNKSKRRSQPRPIAMRTDEVRRRNRVQMRNLMKNSSESSKLDIREQQHADAIGNRNFDNFYSSISAFDDGKYITNDGSLKEIQVQRRKPSVQSDVDIAHQSKPSLMQNISSSDVDFQHANAPDYAVFSRNDAASDSFQLQRDRRYSFQWSSPNAQHYPTVINKAGLSYIRGTPIHLNKYGLNRQLQSGLACEYHMVCNRHPFMLSLFISVINGMI